MFDKILKFIVPHYCCKCNKVGNALCQDCVNYIIKQRKGDPKLTNCRAAGMDLRCFGWRTGVLEKVIDDYKFNLKRELARPLAQLLASQLDDLARQKVIILSIPTTRRHNRQRGFDHMRLIGMELAKLLDATYRPLMKRANQVSQRGLLRADRLANAKESFQIDGRLDKKVTYLVIDDVWTTGATIISAANLLKQHGAKKVVAAVICRQPDKKLNKASLI